MTGYIHSLQSMGTVDGPGVRAVVFASGCPLRCIYCQNPDTWTRREEQATTAEELCGRIERLIPYIKNGGVTFSGGEPCLQAPFFTALAMRLREQGLHIALDTCGAVQNKEVDALLEQVDLVLLDVKMTTEEDHRRYIGNRLADTMAFLEKLESLRKPVWIRHVIVPDLNDNEEDVDRLAALLAPFSCVEKVELLPFRSLCREKYEAMGLDFALKNTNDLSADVLDRFKERLAQMYRSS